MVEFLLGALVFGAGLVAGWLGRGSVEKPLGVKVKRIRWNPGNLLDPVTPEDQRLALRREG